MSVWTRHRRAWLTPAVFAAVGLIALATYYVGFNNRARALDQRLEARRATKAELQRQVATASEYAETLATDQSREESLFGTIEDVPRRMTRYVRHVHELCQKSGLVIDGGIGFGSDELGDFGLAERSMEFDVVGDYDALRRFINFLEVSDSFLALRDIAVGVDRDNQQLKVGLTVSSMFAADPERVES